jgi:hypothetical protein
LKSLAEELEGGPSMPFGKGSILKASKRIGKEAESEGIPEQ